MKSGLLSTGPQSPAAPWSQAAAFGPGDCGLGLAFGISLLTAGGVCLAGWGLAGVRVTGRPVTRTPVPVTGRPVTGALSAGTMFGSPRGLSDPGLWLGGPFDSLGFSSEGDDLPPGP